MACKLRLFFWYLFGAIATVSAEETNAGECTVLSERLAGGGTTGTAALIYADAVGASPIRHPGTGGARGAL